MAIGKIILAPQPRVPLHALPHDSRDHTWWTCEICLADVRAGRARPGGGAGQMRQAESYVAALAAAAGGYPDDARRCGECVFILRELDGESYDLARKLEIAIRREEKRQGG